MGRAGSVILHQAAPRTRVGKAGIVMPRTLPTTFKGESDEDVQERQVGAAAPEEMARSALAGEMNRREAATSFGVTAKTVPKWAGYFRDIGPAGCADRSSSPRRSRRPAPGQCRRADCLLPAPSPDRCPHRRGDRRLAGHGRPGHQARPAFPGSRTWSRSIPPAATGMTARAE